MDNLENNAAEEVEIVDEDTSEEVTEEAAEEAAEEVVEDTAEETDTEDAPKTVPLTALHQEREKLKTLKKEYSELKKVTDRLFKNTGVRDVRELEDRMDNITLQEFIQNKGMDEGTAKTFLMQQKRIAELEKAQGAKDYEAEIKTLRATPYYSDIDDVSDEVIEYADKRGITAKEAYNVLYGEQRANTLQKEAEQKALKQAAVKQSKKIPALSSTGNVANTKGTIKLTSAEAEVAKAAGMTYAEYAKYRKKE